MFKRLFVSLFSVMLIGLIFGFAVAQDDEVVSDQALFDMLALAPADSVGESVFVAQYVDYVAVQIRRNTHVVPKSDAEWEAMIDTDEGALWMYNTRRLIAGPGFLQFLSRMDNVSGIMGFDFFDIERTLLVGEPPAELLIVGNDFDIDSVSTAHQARGYTVTDYNGVDILCGVNGCEEGDRPDLNNRNRDNLFGGDLGRSQPVIVTGDYVISSASYDVVKGVAGAINGDTVTLLDIPMIQAAAEAITDTDLYAGTLAQTLFMTPMATAGLDPGLFDSWDAFIEAYSKLPVGMELAPELADYGELPQYFLAAITDRQEGTDQVAIITLVYDNVDDAEIAAEELTKRLTLFTNMGDTEPFLNWVYEAEVQSPRIYKSDSTGWFVAVAEIRYPLPPTDEVPEVGSVEREPGDPVSFPGQLIRTWINALYARRFWPLEAGMSFPDWFREGVRDQFGGE